MTAFETGAAKVYDSTVKDFISRKHQHLAEILHDYDDTLSVEFIPSLERTDDDAKPFRVVQTPRDGRNKYVVRYLNEREMDDPQQVLLWIWEGDFKKHSPDAVFNRLEAKRLADELLKEKNEADERAERVDLMANLAAGGRDKKHFYRHGGQTFRR